MEQETSDSYISASALGAHAVISSDLNEMLLLSASDSEELDVYVDEEWAATELSPKEEQSVACKEPLKCDAGLLCEAGDETVTLQEVEGTTITLHTGITGIQSDAKIQWFYGPEKAEETILFSQVFKRETVTEISERFKERLQLDRISGALTIRNISRTDSGVYLLHVIAGRLSSRTFSVSVYAPVSAPVIRNQRGNRSVISTEPCFLLCTVENGEDVKLSWYRENERISITNNTDLSVPLNLSLQIQHHDENTTTYICVSANPVSYKTTSLSITQLCYHNSV
ncbi:SLAM family member 8-like [Hemibagrus wyckioides]|uniref:SLAM family member 8-like n=1 Tax=Hemibagrus wyckioides TaxID=337641 RepID=UPI00266C3FD6|nr:SLAM family member 8-like [Hemibagrus wyckioides]